MPRPSRTRAWPACLVTALCCAALGPPTLHAALAAAAGSLFEAAPFVLVSESLAKRRGLRVLTAFASCGCGAAIPGALSFAAIGLCWLAFGPAVALARTVAGVALLARRGPGRFERPCEPSGAFDELLALATSAAVAAVFAGFVANDTAFFAAPAAGFAAFAAGLVLGAFAPCGMAAVAIAAALSPHLRFAAAGVLVSGGLVPRIVFFGSGRNGNVDGSEREREPGRRFGRFGNPWARARRICFARLALGLALGALAFGGPRGFVNPKLLPFEGIGALLAFGGLKRSPPPRRAFAVPAILLVALASGSPVPAYRADETRLDDAFAGERVTFTGVARRGNMRTVVQRFAITCCRVDASAVALRTTAPLPVVDGSWIEATGILLDSPSGLLLRPSSWHRVAPPADPFVYR